MQSVKLQPNVPSLASFQKKITKNSLGKRTPNGSNRLLKETRATQTLHIVEVLNQHKEKLPTIQEILDSVWNQHEEKKELELRPIGDGMSFCDGIKIPKTPLTETMSQVKKLFL